MAFDEIVVSRHTEEDIERAKAIRMALDLRKQGYTMAEIGNQLGIGAPTVSKWIRRALDTYVVDGVEELRELESSRLDEAHRAIWGRVLEGELQAIDRFLAIQARRAKLLGLDTPTKVDLNQSQHPGPRIIEIGVATDPEPGETPGDVLALPSPSVEQHEEDHLPGGRDGIGEDMVRPASHPQGSPQGS